MEKEEKVINGYEQKKQSFQECTNCYGWTENWHLYKGYYWCDGCDYKKLYKLFVQRGSLKERV